MHYITQSRCIIFNVKFHSWRCFVLKGKGTEIVFIGKEKVSVYLYSVIEQLKIFLSQILRLCFGTGRSIFTYFDAGKPVF